MWLRSLALSRSQTKRIDVKPPYRRPVGRRDPVAVALLSTVPGVSTVNARNLVDAFGTLRDLANASAADLSDVHGIGPTRSKSIHDAFNQHS